MIYWSLDFNVAPDKSADPIYGWDYVQTVSDPVVTRTLELVVSNLTPGENRLVAGGTSSAIRLAVVKTC